VASGHEAVHTPRSNWQNGAQYVLVHAFTHDQNAAQQASTHCVDAPSQSSPQTAHSVASQPEHVAAAACMHPLVASH
jgi:hypothetical protein